MNFNLNIFTLQPATSTNLVQQTFFRFQKLFHDADRNLAERLEWVLISLNTRCAHHLLFNTISYIYSELNKELNKSLNKYEIKF